MNSVTLKSGNTLEVQQASFEHSWNLTQAVASELAKGLPGFKVDGLDVEMLQKDLDLGKVMSVVCQLIASPTIYALVWPCFAPCLYNKQKIIKGESVFDDEAARQDFLPCVVEILKANVLPFMKGLDLSSLSKRDPKSNVRK